MSNVLNIIRDEHRSIAAVLHGMRHLVQESRHRFETGAGKDWLAGRLPTLRAMLHYLDSFSERQHHPKEDRFLFHAVRAATHEVDGELDELESEHAAGEAALIHLEHLLVCWQEGGPGEFPAFADAASRYVGRYLAHMRREEEGVFPAAARVLSPADWAAIDRAYSSNRDPLKLHGDVQDYELLFAHIVSLAPAPLGLGPA